jgi:hypothetical protein
MVYLIAIVILGITAVPILSKWRLGVILIFIWLFLEDVIRRLLPGQPQQIMLTKDVLIALTYFSFFLWFSFKNKKIWKPAFGVALFLFAAYVLINIFNLNSPGFLFGLIGLRAYLWYLPLMFLGYYMFDKEEKLLKFCRILVILAIPLFLFVIFQYVFYDSGWPLARPLGEALPYHSFQMFINSSRISGDMLLFSSVFGVGHRYSRFAMLLFFLGLGLLATKHPVSSKKRKIILITSVFSAFLGIFLSSVRTAFALTCVGGILFLVLATFKKNSKTYYFWQNKRLLVFSLISMVSLFLLAFLLLGNRILFQVSVFNDAFKERIPWVLNGFRGALVNSQLFGMGTGTWSQGVFNIPGGTDWISQNSELITTGFRFETGFGRVIFELGIFGAIIFFLFWASLFYQAKKELKLLQYSNLRNLDLGILLFLFLMIFWFIFVHNQVLGDATTLVVLWFFLGVFFGLSKIAGRESAGNAPEREGGPSRSYLNKSA